MNVLPRSSVVPGRPGLGRLALAVALVAPACRSEAPSKASPSASAAKSARPIDRLAPGELAPGTGQVFGLVVPRGMRVRGAFPEIAYLEGNVRPEALSNYVRDRVEVERVEIGAARTLFPGASIRGGPEGRTFDIEVVAGGNHPTRLVVRDVTPTGVNAPPSLTDAERWRQAGRSPDGKPLDMAEFR